MSARLLRTLSHRHSVLPNSNSIEESGTVADSLDPKLMAQTAVSQYCSGHVFQRTVKSFCHAI